MELKELYKLANEQDLTQPAGVIQAMQYNQKIFEQLGRQTAEALKQWKLKEAHRREVLATIYSQSDGTVEDRKQKAEVAAASYRREEAEAEADHARWRYAREATAENINILKKRLDDLKDLTKGGV